MFSELSIRKKYIIFLVRRRVNQHYHIYAFTFSTVIVNHKLTHTYTMTSNVPAVHADTRLHISDCIWRVSIMQCVCSLRREEVKKEEEEEEKKIMFLFTSSLKTC